MGPTTKKEHIAGNIEIDYPTGLDAEFGHFFNTENPEEDVPEEIIEFVDELTKCFGTSADNLGELLIERKNQAEILERLLPQIEKVLIDQNIDSSQLQISFQID